MANSRLFQFRYSYERDLVDIYAKVTFGASGAPTLSNAKGVVSITRNSAGNYTLLLKDNFYLLMDAQAVFKSGSSAPAAPAMNIVSEQVNTVSAPQMVIQFRDIAAAAADPASGEVAYLKITCRNAST